MPCAAQVISQILPALQPAFAAADERLNGVAAGHELPVLTGIVDLHAAVEALQVPSSHPTAHSVCAVMH